MRPRTAHPHALPLASLAVPLSVVLAVVLAGCSGAVDADRSPEAAAATPSAATPSQERGTAPASLNNCGVPVEITAPPARVVTIKSSALELMLALGLQGRVVGAAFLDGPLPADLEDAGEVVPVLSDGAPGQESVLALEPDLVFAGWESNFSIESAGERDDLADLGIRTYVSPSACRTSGYQPNPLTFERVFADIAEAGELFGVPEEAAAVVESQQRRLDAVDRDDRGLSALWYSSGTEVPYVGAGIGAPQMIMDAVGLSNVAGEVEDTWTSFGWEQIVEADPDVIVLVDATWNPAEQKIAFLSENPATARLAAVREERYLVVPFPATEAGVRNVDAVQDLTDQLALLRLE